MPEVKERPILFSGPMVRAILSGQKTVTRRMMKAPDRSWEFGLNEAGMTCGTINSPHPKRGKFGVLIRRELASGSGKYERDLIVCPHGQPGDRLWVREAWVADAQVDSISPRDLSQGEPIWYPADGSSRQTGCSMISQGRTRPSIHMPRWASRVLLEITEVHVERLQDISEEQADAEGVDFLRHVPDADETLSATQLFECLWSSINGTESWDANPWVWVVEFKRVTP